MTSININKDIRNRLKKMGIKDSTWNSILNDLLNHCEGCDLYWAMKE